MGFFNFFTPFIYFLLIVTWAYILIFYLRKYFVDNIQDKLLKTLLLILAIDAFRTFFESSYFGVWFSSLAGIIPIEIYNYLSKPNIVFFPKIINLITSGIILFILIRKWIPAEKNRIETINNLVKTQTEELRENYKKLNAIKEKLAISEAKYKASFEFFPFPVLVLENIDNDFKIISSNRMALLKATKEMNSPFSEISTTFWLNYPELKRYLKKCFETKKTVSVEYEFFAPENGQREIYVITFSFLPKENNVQVIFIDISEQNYFKEELIEQKLLFESMFNTIPDGVVITNTKREILFANNGMKTTFKYEPEEVIGKTTEILYANRENYNNAGANVFDEDVINPDKTYLTKYKKKDNVVFPGETFGTKLYDNNGDWIGNLGVMRDVSERINFINEINEARQKAEESDRLKSAFLANMSHEIRTPLNSIIGFSSLLGEQNKLDSENQKFIKIIQDSGEQLLHIISDILDISKIESNQLVISTVETNIHEEMDELYEIIKQKLNQINSHVELTKNYPLNSKDCIILTDKFRFRQIFLNLLGNAVKFTSKGSIAFGYELIKDNIRFYVKDTGRGISKSEQKKLFQRFSQIKSEDHSEVVSGSGLGLVISKVIAELLGGSMWVESEKNVGSIFYFELPFVKNLNDSAVLNNQNKKISSNVHFNGKRVLIVDDDYSSSFLLETYLNQESMITLVANNGIEAIDLVETNKNIDLVLMDLQMPKLDGYEATKRIKLLHPKLPIIAQTAFAQEGDKEKALEAGCDNFITKPINRTMLFKLLSRHLNQL